MLLEPICRKRKCKHFRGIYQPIEGSEMGETVVCDAFPKGIPSEIAYGPVPHLKPFPGDQGIMFEQGERDSE